MRDLELLIEAAKAAGEIALKHHRQDPEQWEKEDGAGPVSVADLEVDACLKNILQTARPDYGWISEESAEVESRHPANRILIVDPIDGTRAFLDGGVNFAIALAIVEEGLPTSAVIAMPAKDRTYSAAQGEGAYCNGERLAASDRTALTDATLLTPKPTMRPEKWHHVPPVSQQFRSSLAYRLALVAEGRFDAMLTLRDSWVWDIAAGDLIAREAGAKVTNRAGDPLRFDAPSKKVSGVLATGSNLLTPFLSHLNG